jgi:HEPN domain-containing protein
MSDPARWRELAEEDLKMARLALKEGLFRPACFHAQQGVEKVLKGFLLLRTREYPRTHKLLELLSLCDMTDREFGQWVDECQFLDRFYQASRYPDAPAGSLPEGEPGQAEGTRAVQTAGRMTAFVAGKL